MTDKEKIRKEVKRIKTVHSSVSLKDSKPDILAVQICTNLLSFIDSMQEEPVSDDKLEGLRNAFHLALDNDDGWKEEPISEDLEQVAKHYLYSNILYDDVYVGNPTDKDCIEMFKAGADWKHEQMMKDAIPYRINDMPGQPPIVLDHYRLYEQGIRGGDKVKLIIIKED